MTKNEFIEKIIPRMLYAEPEDIEILEELVKPFDDTNIHIVMKALILNRNNLFAVNGKWTMDYIREYVEEEINNLLEEYIATVHNDLSDVMFERASEITDFTAEEMGRISYDNRMDDEWIRAKAMGRLMGKKLLK